MTFSREAQRNPGPYESLRPPHLFTEEWVPISAETSFGNVWCLFGAEEKGWLRLLSIALLCALGWFSGVSTRNQGLHRAPRLWTSTSVLSREKQVGVAEARGQGRWTLGLHCPWGSLKSLLTNLGPAISPVEGRGWLNDCWSFSGLCVWLGSLLTPSSFMNLKLDGVLIS